jgi:ketosteroid isomerase-like protein
MGREIVRWEVEPLRRDRRGFDERMLMRAPRLAMRLNRRISRLPAGSRLRRAVLTRAVRVGYAANNRLDYDALFALFHPQAVFRAIGLEIPLDLPGEVHGVESMRAFLNAQREGFDKLRYEPLEIADPGGDRFGARLRFVALARGIEVEQEAGTTWTIKDGWVVAQDLYDNFDGALAALRDGP